jgi:A/G-specific adenine glycosylase
MTKTVAVDGALASSPVQLRLQISRRLLAWFDRHQRELPWRQNRDPERFLAAFPTLQDLAAADEQAVLRLWAGLGYYRRARDLHRAARLLVTLHDGRIPGDPVILGGLPGFGRYTCNAVLSQAFDRRLPILEANSQRVLSRLFGRVEDPRESAARRWLWQAAEDLLPAKRAGAFNQAMMELGALVCTPAAPRCDACPLAKVCVARRSGLQETIPARSPAPAVTAVQEAAIVIWQAGRVLLAQRPADANRWASMWEFPRGPLEVDETHEAAALRLAVSLGLRVRLRSELTTVRHGITRFQITLVCIEADHESGDFQPGIYARANWVVPAALTEYAASTPQRRLAQALTAAGRQRNLF